MQGRWIIVCPLEHELRTIRGKLRASERAKHLIWVCSGPGAGAVKRAIAAIRPDPGPDDCVILAGCCAGLCAGAELGGVIERILTPDGREFRPTMILDAAAGAARRTLVAVDAVLTTPAAKAELWRRTGAELADMESHALAAAVATTGARWCVLRGVSDTHNESLPEQAGMWITPDGRTRTGRVVMDLMKAPWLTPGVMNLARRTGVGLAQVAAQLDALLAQPAAMAGRDA